MKILVAGASGLIGWEVVRVLRQRDVAVRTLSRHRGRAEQLASLGVNVRVADATVAGALDGCCAGIDVVVPALGAPVASVGGRRAFADVDLVANRALVAEAVRAGVRRFVYVGVFGSPSYADTAYVRAHSLVEEAVRGSGLEYGFVRPTAVFGALAAEFLGVARRGMLPLIGDGSAVVNPVHERDVAEAVVTSATAMNAVVVDIGGPKTLTRRQLAELVFRALGKKPRVWSFPVWLMRAAAWAYGFANRRMGEFLRFVILASTHPCVAPATGKRMLAEYLGAEGRRETDGIEKGA